MEPNQEVESAGCPPVGSALGSLVSKQVKFALKRKSSTRLTWSVSDVARLVHGLFVTQIDIGS